MAVSAGVELGGLTASEPLSSIISFKFRKFGLDQDF
jgi:hypothetical protein